ncbi:MAG: hypothetical protein G01um101470_696 [Parcubacteria group bacterium Gr01-1014_70]|nr:MAG: hypothetical protein G01um101470_696 [Parcubacteria group bacterium Gr01-1014_70]
MAELVAVEVKSPLLAELLGDVQGNLQRVEERQKNVSRYDQQIDSLHKKLDEAARIRDERRRKETEAVLKATLAEMEARRKADEQDIAEAMFGYHVFVEELGKEISGLTQISEEDQARIEQVKRDLEAALVERQEAEKKWLFRDHAVAVVDEKITHLTQLKQDVEKEAQANVRKRIRSANLEASFQEFMLRVETMKSNLESMISQASSQIQVLATEKTRVFSEKEVAAQAFQELDAGYKTKTAELQDAQDRLAEMTSGTVEYETQTGLIAHLETDVEDLRGKTNNALSYLQQKERYAKDHVENELSHRKVRDNLRIMHTILKTSAQERMITFRSHILLTQEVSGQEAADKLHSIGTEADQRILAYVVGVGASSDRLRMDMLEKHPEIMEEQQKIINARAEAEARILEREEAFVKLYKEKYNIDATQGFVFRHLHKENAQAS